MALKGGAIWAGYLMPWDKLAYAIDVGQHYLMENTTLGIPALIQSEGSFLLLVVFLSLLFIQDFTGSPTTERYGLHPSDLLHLSTQTS